MNLTIEEAIKSSIIYETRVRDVYADALKTAEDPTGKRVFEILAEEEQHHLDYLNHKLEEWEKTGKATAEGLKTAIPTRTAIEKGVSKLQRTMSEEDRGSELKMLQKAWEVENETSTFYKKMVDELPAEGQELFSRFVEIEEGHLALVQAELDYMSGTGFWFDFQEFDMEE